MLKVITSTWWGNKWFPLFSFFLLLFSYSCPPFFPIALPSHPTPQSQAPTIIHPHESLFMFLGLPLSPESHNQAMPIFSALFLVILYTPGEIQYPGEVEVGYYKGQSRDNRHGTGCVIQDIGVPPGWCPAAHWHGIRSRFPDWQIKSEQDGGKKRLETQIWVGSRTVFAPLRTLPCSPFSGLINGG